MSEKNRDKQNRWRTETETVAFRVSPEEYEELTNRIKLCGFRTKQEFLIQSALEQKVTAVGNPLMLVQFRQQLARIEQELQRINEASEIDVELFTPIRTMVEILDAFKENELEILQKRKLE